MKRVLVAIFLMLVLVFGITAGVQVLENSFKAKLRQTPEWQNLVADLQKYQDDRIDMTNKIDQVVDNKTRAALNSIKSCVQDNRVVIQDLKAVIILLKENQ
jgi:Tfp pilus assembly protein PilV